MKNFEKDIRQIQKETPNSQELGDKVKAYIIEFDKEKKDCVEVEGVTYEYIQEESNTFDCCRGCALEGIVIKGTVNCGTECEERKAILKEVE